MNNKILHTLEIVNDKLLLFIFFNISNFDHSNDCFDVNNKICS